VIHTVRAPAMSSKPTEPRSIASQLVLSHAGLRLFADLRPRGFYWIVVRTRLKKTMPCWRTRFSHSILK